MKTLTSFVLVALMAMLPIQIHSEQPAQPRTPDQPQEWALAVCIVAVCGAAVAGIYIVSKKCQPKYYWLWDGENPPTTWVGTATDKQCQLEGWKKISGPYDKPGDAPPVCPSLTNRVEKGLSVPVTISVEASTNMMNWVEVYSERCDFEDFAYFPPTNAPNTMFRLKVVQ